MATTLSRFNPGVHVGLVVPASADYHRDPEYARLHPAIKGGQADPQMLGRLFFVQQRWHLCRRFQDDGDLDFAVFVNFGLAVRRLAVVDWELVREPMGERYAGRLLPIFGNPVFKCQIHISVLFSLYIQSIGFCQGIFNIICKKNKIFLANTA